MGAPQTISFGCNFRIMQAKNIELKHTKKLFIRCYLSVGNKERVQINTQEISSKSDLYWDESFCLECLGSQDSINLLKQGNIVLELRYRGIMGSSKALATTEIPWRTVFESQNMEIERWVSMIMKNGGVDEDIKPPAVKIGIKVNINGDTRKRRNDRLDECGCIDGNCDYSLDYELFALGFALESL